MSFDKPKIETRYEDFGRSTSITATFDQPGLHQSLFIKAIEKAAILIAERYVEENYMKIAEALSPQVIANLAIAKAGASIATELKQEAATKTKIVETVKTQVFQRGILGGLSRL